MSDPFRFNAIIPSLSGDDGVHPFLLELGRFRLPTYGVISLVALAIAVVIIHRFARIEGLPRGRPLKLSF
jgi:prolipoprotein diacylglyceryltransferase